MHNGYQIAILVIVEQFPNGVLICFLVCCIDTIVHMMVRRAYVRGIAVTTHVDVAHNVGSGITCSWNGVSNIRHRSISILLPRVFITEQLSMECFCIVNVVPHGRGYTAFIMAC